MGGYGFYIFAAAIVIAIGWAITLYNRLVAAKQRVSEGWSGVDVQLRRRSNLIPNLVDTVKGYMEHERSTLEKITELRQQSANAESKRDDAERAQAEGMLSGSLLHLFAVAENYPDLKANQTFQDLQENLAEIEEQIQLARRYFNGAVRDNNILVETVPSNIVAKLFSFTTAAYFEVEDASERAVPKIEFGSKK
ncbi:LemA family protein [Hwanghaeella grinnelliae]|uniref:LemA family protein n=1 Tax=Hwanghaeella grinnelliae TaxID=2500179 RepID=UPI001F00BEE2|nr:LemA family protein [Hwanghaeella grinnelliae]